MKRTTVFDTKYYIYNKDSDIKQIKCVHQNTLYNSKQFVLWLNRAAVSGLSTPLNIEFLTRILRPSVSSERQFFNDITVIFSYSLVLLTSFPLCHLSVLSCLILMSSYYIIHSLMIFTCDVFFKTKSFGCDIPSQIATVKHVLRSGFLVVS